MPPGTRSALPTNRPVRRRRGAPRDGGGDVPRDGHAVLAGASRGGVEERSSWTRARRLSVSVVGPYRPEPPPVGPELDRGGLALPVAGRTAGPRRACAAVVAGAGAPRPVPHVPNRPFFDILVVKGGGDAVSASPAVLQTLPAGAGGGARLDAPPESGGNIPRDGHGILGGAREASAGRTR